MTGLIGELEGHGAQGRDITKHNNAAMDLVIRVTDRCCGKLNGKFLAAPVNQYGILLG